MADVLEITTRASCALRCKFCPQDVLPGAHTFGERELSLENFELVLRKLPASVSVHFSGFVEPFFNRHAARMAFLARWTPPQRTVHIYTTLMGLRDGEMLEALQLSKPDYVCVHVPDSEGMIIADDKWIAQHELFRRTGLRADYEAMGDLTPRVRAYLDGLGIPVEQPAMISRASNLWRAEHLDGPITCRPQRYHSNVLLPDGTVVGCCMLYSLEVTLGNLFVEPYEAIWQRAEAWANEKNPPESSPCRVCEWAGPLETSATGLV
jgi:radical SAM protein with 4Fe4S-binding SPASM domain